MKITVTRTTGWIGFAARLKVFVNGMLAGKVANLETSQVQIQTQEGEPAILSIKGMRQSNLLIHEGDHILIETNPTFMTCFSLGMGLLVLSLVLRFFSNLGVIASGFLAIPLFVATFFMEQYKLTKIN